MPAESTEEHASDERAHHADHDVTGPRVFDLQIALAAIDNGATELWTHDTHFVQVPGLRVVYPLHAGRTDN
jgi:predicted nucleic acid-binding protein